MNGHRQEIKRLLDEIDEVAIDGQLNQRPENYAKLRDLARQLRGKIEELEATEAHDGR